eukprot:COSAG05_NODE_5699_length_1113_cov_1.339250_2_plen_49_part_01
MREKPNQSFGAGSITAADPAIWLSVLSFRFWQTPIRDYKEGTRFETSAN